MNEKVYDKIKLTAVSINRNNEIVGYEGFYLVDNSKVGLTIQGAWLEAKYGDLVNVIATGNPVIPDPLPDGEYKFEESEINKMGLQGVNGFNINDLPREPHWFKY